MAEYTIDEASRLSGITVRSLRNYVHHYAEFLELKRGAYNALLFSEDDLQMLVKIKSLLRDGTSRQQIVEILQNEAAEPTMQVTKHPVAATEQPVILPLLKKIDTVLTDLLDENRLLHERLQCVEEELARTRVAALQSSMRALPPAAQPSSSVGVPVPYFLLAAKDGCMAVARSFWQVFVRGGIR